MEDIIDMDQLDKVLAERLMGWIWSKEHQMWVLDSERDADGRLTFGAPDALSYDEEKDKQEPWSPTKNITQALGNGEMGTIVYEMYRRGFWFSITLLNSCMVDNKPTDNGYYFAEFYKTEDSWNSWADTPSSAICLAVAAALGLETPPPDGSGKE